MRSNDIHCPPSDYGRDCQTPAPVTILEHAAAASDAANYYRSVMDDRADFRTTINAAAALARATHALTTAIADAVAESDGQLAAPSEMDLWRQGKGPRPGTKPGYW